MRPLTASCGLFLRRIHASPLVKSSEPARSHDRTLALDADADAESLALQHPTPVAAALAVRLVFLLG